MDESQIYLNCELDENASLKSNEAQSTLWITKHEIPRSKELTIVVTTEAHISKNQEAR